MKNPQQPEKSINPLKALIEIGKVQTQVGMPVCKFKRKEYETLLKALTLEESYKNIHIGIESGEKDITAISILQMRGDKLYVIYNKQGFDELYIDLDKIIKGEKSNG